jgi:hypothetical protein
MREHSGSQSDVRLKRSTSSATTFAENSAASWSRVASTCLKSRSNRAATGLSGPRPLNRNTQSQMLCRPTSPIFAAWRGSHRRKSLQVSEADLVDHLWSSLIRAASLVRHIQSDLCRFVNLQRVMHSEILYNGGWRSCLPRSLQHTRRLPKRPVLRARSARALWWNQESY